MAGPSRWPSLLDRSSFLGKKQLAVFAITICGVCDNFQCCQNKTNVNKNGAKWLRKELQKIKILENIVLVLA